MQIRMPIAMTLKLSLPSPSFHLLFLVSILWSFSLINWPFLIFRYRRLHLARRQRINRRFESRGVSRFARVRRLKRCLIGFLDLMSVFLDNKQHLGQQKIQQICQVEGRFICLVDPDLYVYT